MSFIRRKTVNGRVYLYEVESWRDPAGVVRQRVLKYIGPEQPVYGTKRTRAPRKEA